MSHELDTTTGREAIAYVGQTPWHGLGQLMLPGLPIGIWLKQAGLDWHCLRAGVEFDRQDGTRGTSDKDTVLYRSDSGSVLSIVDKGYRPVQPNQILEFFDDLTKQHGFQLETAGSLKGGRKIWALAKTPHEFTLRGNDRTQLYLLLATSFDRTMSTQARWTGVRVVCNNTIEIATMGRADVVVPHSTDFDADKVKVKLEVGDAFEKFAANAKDMSERLISKEESAHFLLNVYLGLETAEQRLAVAEDPKVMVQIDKLTARMQQALFNSPGAHLASARGTLWGVLNAVTNDVDFSKPARSQENRLNSAWFGPGAQIKQRAWELAARMVA